MMFCIGSVAFLTYTVLVDFGRMSLSDLLIVLTIVGVFAFCVITAYWFIRGIRTVYRIFTWQNRGRQS